jgi:hypothetical protein
MASKHIAAFLSLVMLLSCFFGMSSNLAALARTKKRTHHSRGHYFVPPPPPYTPSILPETGTSAIQARAEGKTDGPYRKYIYERSGGGPQVVQPNKYVTYWNKT